VPRINEDYLKGSLLIFDHSPTLPRPFLDKTIKELSEFFTWIDPKDIYLISWITPLLKDKYQEKYIEMINSIKINITILI
jgi:hypothetical protein